jgi:HEAT repeat protein
VSPHRFTSRCEAKAKQWGRTSPAVLFRTFLQDKKVRSAGINSPASCIPAECKNAAKISKEVLMKKVTSITLAIYLCFLFFHTSLFALQQNNKPVKPQLDPKYARIIVCSKALEALGRIGDPRMKDVLTSGLKNKEFLIRASAAEALSRLGDKKTIPLLKESLKDENYMVRILATKALLKLGEADMEKPLLEFLNSNEASVRAAVVEQLGQFKDKYLSRLAGVLLKDSSYLVRLRAIQQLGINRFNPALPLIQQALSDPNPKIRQVACIAVGQINDIRMLDFVMGMLNDGEAIVRSAAKEGVTMLKSKRGKLASVTGEGEGEDRLRILLRKDLDNKDSALRISSFVGLANLGDETILPLLLKEVVFPGNTTLVKKGAARALRILKPYVIGLFDRVAKSSVISSENLELEYKANGENLLSLMINALKDDASPLHSDSVFVLGELKDNASLPALRQALSQGDPDIVANVAYVLGLFQDKEAVPYLIKVCNSYGL